MSLYDEVSTIFCYLTKEGVLYIKASTLVKKKQGNKVRNNLNLYEGKKITCFHTMLYKYMVFKCDQAGISFLLDSLPH